MIWKMFLMAVVLAFVSSASAADAPPAKGRSIEVCFVLDTTGSMSGLIEGAKQKIWSIANELISSKPKPDKIQFALVAYRDRNDAYVTQVFDLTNDLDTVFKNLQGFKADGGNDEPESVNQALDEAVEKITWSKDRDVLKIVFLVGDAPPHMDYKDDVKYPEVLKKAVAKDLIVNTVQCGGIAATGPIWREIARLGEGSFIQLGQTGDMVAIATPMDAELADLNRKIGATLVACNLSGELQDREVQALAEKQVRSETSSTEVTAGRLAYNVKSGKSVQGNDELIDALQQNRVKLADLRDNQLPPNMRTMSLEQRQTYTDKLLADRKEINSRISELTKQRDDFIVEEKKKLAAAGKKEAFDEQVTKIITEQAARKAK